MNDELVAQTISEQQMDDLRKALQKEYDRLADLVGEEANRNQADWNPDRGELAAAASRRDRRLAIQELNEEKLAQVTEALARMDEGTYGTCLSCGKPINPERLEIVPYAGLCTSCQSHSH
jgi:RNA polymerase-binding protein DksA